MTGGQQCMKNVLNTDKPGTSAYSAKSNATYAQGAGSGKDFMRQYRAMTKDMEPSKQTITIKGIFRGAVIK